MAPPLVTLLSAESEIQYVALRNINLIVQKSPQTLAHEVKVSACAHRARICRHTSRRISWGQRGLSGIMQGRLAAETGCQHDRAYILASAAASAGNTTLNPLVLIAHGSFHPRRSSGKHLIRSCSWVHSDACCETQLAAPAGVFLQIQRPHLCQDGEAGDHDQVGQRAQH